jgi:hypothetical protein
MLPCKRTGECPYEYDKDSERDIEGMPFIADDPRSCPEYGHICPEFMEELGLTLEELQIRSVLHCGSVARRMIEDGKLKKDPQTEILLAEYEKMKVKYPLIAMEYE